MNGAIKFMGEMVGITDAKSAALAGLTVISFFGMKAGMKGLSDNQMRLQQEQLRTYIQREVARDIAGYRGYGLPK